MSISYFGALNPDSMKAFGHRDGEFYEFLIKPSNEQIKIRVREGDIPETLRKLFLNDFFGIIYPC